MFVTKFGVIKKNNRFNVEQKLVSGCESGMLNLLPPANNSVAIIVNKTTQAQDERP